MYTTVLLDAGGVILDEQKYEEETKELLFKIINSEIGNYSFEKLDTDINESINVFAPHNRQYVIWKYCNNNIDSFYYLWKKFKTEWNKLEHDLVLMKGISGEIKMLSRKYSIILAGQYGQNIIELLKENNILQYFSNTLNQDNFSITKPDPRYFEQICKQSLIHPVDCIMVGDRIDKDILPAKQNNMGTVFIKSGIYKNQTARTPDEIPDVILDSVIGLSNRIEEKFA
jgi:putative hydrolase of the HAD superfamily